MNRYWHIAIGIILMTGLTPASSNAQGLTVSFGAGMAHPLHADLDFNAPLLAVTAQIPVGRHMALEPEFTRWEHTTTVEEIGLTIQGVQGPIGHAGRLITRRSRTSWSIGANGLARGGGRTLRVFGGGGIGLYVQESSYRVTLEDCVVPTQPSVCTDQRIDRSRGDLGVQAIGGIDVVLAPRWIAFGAFRAEVQSFRDPGGASVISGLGGVRIGFGR